MQIQGHSIWEAWGQVQSILSVCPVGAHPAACGLLCILALLQAPERPQVAHLPLVGERGMKSLEGAITLHKPTCGGGHAPAAGDWNRDGAPHSLITVETLIWLLCTQELGLPGQVRRRNVPGP